MATQKNYAQLTAKAKLRTNPDNIFITKSFSNELGSISYNEVLDYVRVAMNGVEQEYTDKSIEAGNRVKEHLKNELQSVEYKYQGSVMTNTHIKGHSDIDLVVISSKFYSINRQELNSNLTSFDVSTRFYSSQIQKMKNEVNMSDYLGNSVNDLKQNRLTSETIMQKTYSICNIRHPKAIKITNTSLKRDVDIVIANWYDDARSVIFDKGENRGIQIYDKDYNLQSKVDFPFISIYKINTRSLETYGRLKKMIRFLKTVKADSTEEIKISSFDINAICYNIPVNKYSNLTFYQLVEVLHLEIEKICLDVNYADKIISVDEREYIFKYDYKKIENLKKLQKEIQNIYLDLKQNTSVFL